MIEVEGLVKRYGPRTVLDGISLSVESGEILAVMGSSGGGKTTLLKCIAGLIKYDAGKVTVDGISVKDDPEDARRHLGLVFQSAALFDYLNVADNVLFGVRRRRELSRKQEKALLQDILEKIGLEGTEALMPAELSGGMRKRVGLARALAMGPTTILYDEPTTGLDPVSTYAIDALIDETRDVFKVASIVVSHDVSSVFRVADKIAFLEEGKLTFLGTSEEFANSRHETIRELVHKAQTKSFAGASEQ